MQLRLPIALSIFIGSYLPLSLILLAQNFDYTSISRPYCWGWLLNDPSCKVPFSNPHFAIGIFIVCLCCFAITIVTLSLTNPKHPIAIRECKHIPSDLMNYVLPYVVSFMSIDYQETGKFVGFLIFMAWMFWITFKSGQIMLNPLLIAFGWRFYEITYIFPGNDNSFSGVALTQTQLDPGDNCLQTSIQDIIIIKSAQAAEG